VASCHPDWGKDGLTSSFEKALKLLAAGRGRLPPQVGHATKLGHCRRFDYGQISKTFAVVNLNQSAAGRYSPAEVVRTDKTVVSGMPDVTYISTSHVEKQNHTLRMHCRRLTRLTNAFSKKFENFKAAIALNFAYYNRCKTHGAVRMTPAQAAGVEQSAWTVAKLVERCGE